MEEEASSQYNSLSPRFLPQWENHSKSMKLEAQTLEKIRNRITEKVMSGSGTWIDWQYLLDASSLLARCRYTLQYTYPYAYYMEASPRKELVSNGSSTLEMKGEVPFTLNPHFPLCISVRVPAGAVGGGNREPQLEDRTRGIHGQGRPGKSGEIDSLPPSFLSLYDLMLTLSPFRRLTSRRSVGRAC